MGAFNQIQQTECGKPRDTALYDVFVRILVLAFNLFFVFPFCIFQVLARAFLLCAIQVKCVPAVFFASADTVDLAARLQALDCRCYHDAFVVYAVRASLDRNTEDQRRMSAEFALLADKGLLTRQQLCRAFEKLVQSTDDIELVRIWKRNFTKAGLLRLLCDFVADVS